MQEEKHIIQSVSASRFVFVEHDLLRTLFYCILFLVATVAFLIIGLMIGYSILGEGNPLDVLKWDTWQHILNFLK